MSKLYGFRAWNDDGLCQIDSNYSNLGLIKKTKVTCSQQVYKNFPRYRGTTTFNCSEPVVIACRNTIENNVFFITSITRVDNKWTISIDAGSVNEIEVYIFGPPLHSAGKVGLNIYKADGTLAFTSEHPYMQIAEVHDLTGKWPQYIYTGLPKSKYAITQITPIEFVSRQMVQGQFINAVMTPVYNATSNGIIIRYGARNPIPDDSYDKYQPRALEGNVLIIDVSKYDQIAWT